MKHAKQAPIVADGHSHARAALIEQVTREVQARYAEALAVAGFWGRLRLRRRMRQEIERRMEELAPDNALYLVHRWREAEASLNSHSGRAQQR